MINLDGLKFRASSNTKNAETSENTLFYYSQEGPIVSADYSGGDIVRGHLIGIMDEDGKIDMRYHQVNSNHEIRTGVCTSQTEKLSNGKVRLHESWRWTSGDESAGSSILDEV